MTAASEPLLPASMRLANAHLRLSALKGDSLDEEGSLECTEPAQRPRASACRRAGVLLFVLLAATAAGGAATLGCAGWQCMQAAAARAATADYPRFLVVGDWGRRGDHNQSAVAAGMARKAARMGGVHFVLSTGDNFYPSGLTSPLDPLFDKSFSSVYHQSSLQVPWHAVLGNHDYGQFPEEDPDEASAAAAAIEAGTEAGTAVAAEAEAAEAAAAAGATAGGAVLGRAEQGAAVLSGGGGPQPKCGKSDRCYYSPLHELDASLLQRDPRWHCERSYTLQLAGGRVEIFFFDTTPLMREYADAPWRSNRGGLVEQSPEGGLRELEARLARSRAAWKLVVGHHPIRTNHRDWHEFEELVEQLDPLLRRYRVQAYFCGHDHNLQHLKPRTTPYHQVTSGAGSRLSSPDFSGTRDSPFQAAVNGFVAVRMGEHALTVEYMGLDADEPLFSIDIPQRP